LIILVGQASEQWVDASNAVLVFAQELCCA
jgi:hypothetical protein